MHQKARHQQSLTLVLFKYIMQCSQPQPEPPCRFISGLKSNAAPLRRLWLRCGTASQLHLARQRAVGEPIEPGSHGERPATSGGGSTNTEFVDGRSAAAELFLEVHRPGWKVIHGTEQEACDGTDDRWQAPCLPGTERARSVGAPGILQVATGMGQQAYNFANRAKRLSGALPLGADRAMRSGAPGMLQSAAAP